MQIFAYRIPGAEDILEEYEGGNLLSNKEEMVSSLLDFVNKHKDKKAPRSEASEQFDHNLIYTQLEDMFIKGIKS